MRPDDKQHGSKKKVHVRKRYTAFMLHEALGYNDYKVKHIPASLNGLDPNEKWEGTEEYGDQFNNDDSAWSIKFSDAKFNKVTICSIF